MSATLYRPIYFILVTLLTIIIVYKYPSSYIKFRYRDVSYQSQTLLLATFMILFIGLRPISGWFTDMRGYEHTYNVYYGTRFWFDKDADNFIFDNLIVWMASQEIDIVFFFFLFSLIYFGCMVWASIKLFPRDSLLSFIMYLGAFSTFSFGTNGIKAGAAASLFLVALAYFKEKRILAILFLWLSLGFHHSMLVPITAFVIAFFYKKPKAYLYGWLFCLLLAALHITFFMNLFSSFTDEHGAGYLDVETEDAVLNVSGFRPDFILYSAVPIFVGYFLINTKKIKDKTYHFLWCVYTLTNCVFLLCTYGSFINRIAYLSWLMLPFVLLYPYTNINWSKQQNEYLRYIIWGHLGFSLFMFFIYDNLR